MNSCELLVSLTIDDMGDTVAEFRTAAARNDVSRAERYKVKVKVKV